MGTLESGSGKKAEALFLSPEAPYPAIGGGPVRSASILEYLARRYRVHAVVFHQADEPDPAAAMRAERVHRLDVLDLPRHSKRPLARAARNAVRLLRNRPPLVDRFSGFGERLTKFLGAHEYEIAVIEHFWCAPYVEQVRARTRRVILDLHNIESTWYASVANQESFGRRVALRRFAAAATILERRWLPAFESILVTSRADAERVRGLAGGANICVYPNALAEIPQPARLEQHEIVFSGNLEYAPNISAIRFFKQSIWPAVRSRWPQLRWRIIGKNPGAIRDLVEGDSRIELTGFVEDAVAELARAQVAVVPLLSGSGTRVKILEAWAAGTPVVTTTIGIEGLEYEDGKHVLVADDATRFAKAVSRLLESPEERSRVGSAGRQIFEERYTWPAAWKLLDSPVGNNLSVEKV